MIAPLAAFVGGIVVGVIVTGGAWYGWFISTFGPADEQDIDRKEQA